VWKRIQKIAISKQFTTHFKAKREKDVGTPFPPHFTPAFHSMHICNFRTLFCMVVAQTANKDYWQHFVFSHVFFVNFVPAPAFFSAWTCVCFANSNNF